MLTRVTVRFWPLGAWPENPFSLLKPGAVPIFVNEKPPDWYNVLKNLSVGLLYQVRFKLQQTLSLTY